MTIPQFTAGQVLTAAQLNAMVDEINAGGQMQVTAFTTGGTFTVPAGVTYAVAHIQAGGGGSGRGDGTAAGTGGTSSVAFASGTVSATGGIGANFPNVAGNGSIAGAVNSGNGASAQGTSAGAIHQKAQDGAYIVAGATVTPLATITVTVGAGGTAGSASGAVGGSGYVWIEYQV